MEHQIMYAFDLIGTVVFAITGAIRGVRLRLDLLGVIVFACTVGVGGGMMRDVIIGATPVAALRDKNYLIACIITGLIIFYSASLVQTERRLIIFFDAIGLGVFTAIGAAKGVEYDLNFVGVVLTGVFTAVGGGVIRDILGQRIPLILVGDFYASASLLGGILYLGLIKWVPVPFFWRFMIVMFFVTVIRMLAIRYHLHLPIAGIRFRRRRPSVLSKNKK